MVVSLIPFSQSHIFTFDWGQGAGPDTAGAITTATLQTNNITFAPKTSPVYNTVGTYTVKVYCNGPMTNTDLGTATTYTITLYVIDLAVNLSPTPSTGIQDSDVINPGLTVSNTHPTLSTTPGTWR